MLRLLLLHDWARIGCWESWMHASMLGLRSGWWLAPVAVVHE